MLLDSDDVSYSGGCVICNKTGASKALAEIAGATYRAMKLPPNTEPGLVATHFWEPANFCFPFGAHIVITDIDRDTGQVHIRRYVAVDDCGNILNPLLVDGQVHGGVAQGLGQALWEEAVYDDSGQLITGEFMDYTMPRAHMMPWIESEHTTTPTDVNPLGVKGVGEAGNHRRVARRGEFLSGRVVAPGRPPHRYADDARKNLEADRREKLMIPHPFDYSAPKTLDEAMRLVAAGAKPLAGGMSLIPMMKLRLAAPEQLVDLARIKDLSVIRESGNEIHIGATATHYSVESSAVIRAKCPLLAATAAAIGDVQVRNVGTIGGSVAHADPASDYPAALQALEAKIRDSGRRASERTISAADFFVDAFTTVTLEPGEIVR